MDSPDRAIALTVLGVALLIVATCFGCHDSTERTNRAAIAAGLEERVVPTEVGGDTHVKRFWVHAQEPQP